MVIKPMNFLKFIYLVLLLFEIINPNYIKHISIVYAIEYDNYLLLQNILININFQRQKHKWEVKDQKGNLSLSHNQNLEQFKNLWAGQIWLKSKKL